MIIVKEKAEAKKLYALSLWFEEVIKMVEKYWNVRSDLVCIAYCDKNHQ